MERIRYINAYNGPSTERSPLDCEKEWKKLGLSNIDVLLYEQLSNAIQNNNDKVTIIDIGSGKEGKLLDSIVSNPSVIPMSRRFMSDHPNLSIELIGLTDSLDETDFGKPLLQKNILETDIKARFINIGYSLTASQSFSQFLTEQGISQINLALATWSLAYLSPHVFKEVVGITTSMLSSKGRFIGVGYNDTVSGMGFKYHPDKDTVHFSVKSSSLQDDLWETLLQEFQYKIDPDREEQIQPLELIKQYLFKVVSALASDINEQDLHQDILQASTLHELGQVAETLKNPIRKRWEYKFEQVFKPQKEAILAELTDNSQGTLLVEKSYNNLFSIQKK